MRHLNRWALFCTTMLEDYKKGYVDRNFQFVLVDGNGLVVDGGSGFLPIQKGRPISGFHPFFESIAFLDSSISEKETFNSVHLTVDEKEFIADITLLKQDKHTLIVIHDLTQHYQNYQVVAQARNESIINSELIVLKNAELEEREYFKNRFIQNFSHELRNPLTSIISITNLLSKTPLDNEQRPMLDFLKDSNAQLKLLLEDILDISMINSGRLGLQRKQFSLWKVLDFLRFTYQAKAKEKGLSFVLNLDKKVPEYVEGDRLRLLQVLTNLLENAIKYTDEGKVALAVQVNQKRANTVSLRFIVMDSGVGIAEDDRKSIYESFSRLSQSQSGVGLGLSIVKGLLELMGSEIKMESTIGKGSSFYFDLTLKYPLFPKGNPSMGERTVTSKKRMDLTGKKYRVLLVEDDERTQMTLFKTLADTSHFYVDVISDGAKAMEEVLNNDYDLILMDVNLPNIPGDELTKLIRDFPFKEIKKIPIIGLTANAFKDDVKKYLGKGMNAVLSKPYDEKQLLHTMYKYLKK